MLLDNTIHHESLQRQVTLSPDYKKEQCRICPSNTFLTASELAKVPPAVRAPGTVRVPRSYAQVARGSSTIVSTHSEKQKHSLSFYTTEQQQQQQHAAVAKFLESGHAKDCWCGGEEGSQFETVNTESEEDGWTVLLPEPR